METEIINGHKAIVRHIFHRKELKVGTRWVPADGSNLVVTIDEIKIYPASDHRLECTGSNEQGQGGSIYG